jgi:hypothetical protein
MLKNLHRVDEFVAEFCGGLAIHLFCEKGVSFSLSLSRDVMDGCDLIVWERREKVESFISFLFVIHCGNFYYANASTSLASCSSY